MQQGAERLLGEHDFRNYCRIDAGNVFNYVRTVVAIRFDHVRDDMWVATITGHSFLWHQVRMMMAVLFLVGAGQEEPEIVSFLLDVVACPARPVYLLASDNALVLYECSYENVEFNTDPQALLEIMASFEKQKERVEIEDAVFGSLKQLLGDTLVTSSHGRVPFNSLTELAPKRKTPPYKPIKQLQTECKFAACALLLMRESNARAAARKSEPCKTPTIGTKCSTCARFLSFFFAFFSLLNECRKKRSRSGRAGTTRRRQRRMIFFTDCRVFAN
jgi:hypothetical protein